MKEVKAIIRPTRLDDVRTALRNVPGFPGMTVTKVEGCSAPDRVRPANYKEDLIDFSPKIRIDMIVEDQYADALKQAVIDAGTTKHVGDGIVWVTQVESFEHLWQRPQP